MATKKTKVVVNSNGRNIDHTVEAAMNGKAPVRIKVQKGAKYLLKGDDGFAPENVTLTRVGNDLQITLEGETSPGLVLEGYYAQSEPVGLYGVAEDGQLYAYARTDGAGDIYALAEGQSAPVALGGDSYGPGAPYLAGTEAAGGNDFFGGMLPLLMTGGLAALGLGAIAAASGSDGDTAPSLPPVMPRPTCVLPASPASTASAVPTTTSAPSRARSNPAARPTTHDLIFSEPAPPAIPSPCTTTAKKSARPLWTATARGTSRHRRT